MRNNRSCHHPFFPISCILLVPIDKKGMIINNPHNLPTKPKRLYEEKESVPNNNLSSITEIKNPKKINN